MCYCTNIKQFQVKYSRRTQFDRSLLRQQKYDYIFSYNFCFLCYHISCAVAYPLPAYIFKERNKSVEYIARNLPAQLRVGRIPGYICHRRITHIFPLTFSYNFTYMYMHNEEIHLFSYTIEVHRRLSHFRNDFIQNVERPK